MSSGAFIFKTTHFSKALSDIRKTHFTREELNAAGSEEGIDAFLKAVEAMQEAQLIRFSEELTGLDLYRIVNGFKRPLTKPLKDKLLRLLGIGCSGRLFKYVWRLLEKDYENSGLLTAWLSMKAFVMERCPIEYAQSLIGILPDKMPSLIDGTIEAITSYEGTLQDFLPRYSLDRDTPFVKALIKGYFAKCSKEGILRDKYLFTRCLKDQSFDPADMAAHYLNVCAPAHYIKDINAAVFERFGEPESGRGFWTALNPELTAMISEWQRTHALQEVFGANQTKLSFWSRYFLKVSYDWFEEDGLLILRLPKDYVVVDLASDERCSYLYKKAFFEQQFKQFKERRERAKGGWHMDFSGAVLIRDAQINSINANVFRIVYEGVGRLYTMEIIEDSLDA